MLKRLAVLLLALWAAPTMADEAAKADSGPKIALPHNCVSFYPEAAVRANAEGVAIVTFTITADGLVKDPKLAKSSGNADLDTASLQCVAGWQYIPAKRGGAAVEAPWQAAVQWKLHGGANYEMMAHCAHYHALTAAMFASIPGVTVLTYRVMPNGVLSDIAVARSSGDKSLDDAAQTCLRDAHYTTGDLDIPDGGIPAHAVMDWKSEYRRGVPLVPPFPPGLTPPVLVTVAPCDALSHARAPAHDGTTALAFTVATDGSVSDATVTHTSGTPALDEALRTCVLAWRFAPAVDGDMPYAVKWSFEAMWRAGEQPADVDKL